MRTYLADVCQDATQKWRREKGCHFMHCLTLSHNRAIELIKWRV
jgi:hypothetical protein